MTADYPPAKRLVRAGRNWSERCGDNAFEERAENRDDREQSRHRSRKKVNWLNHLRTAPDSQGSIRQAAHVLSARAGG